MRGTEHFKNHLSVVTYVDNKKISETPVEDPFYHTTVHIVMSFWDRLWNLFAFRVPEIEVRVYVRADGVAIGRWFQGADICEKCKTARIGFSDGSSSSTSVGVRTAITELSSSLSANDAENGCNDGQ